MSQCVLSSHTHTFLSQKSSRKFVAGQLAGASSGKASWWGYRFSTGDRDQRSQTGCACHRRHGGQREKPWHFTYSLPYTNQFIIKVGKICYTWTLWGVQESHADNAKRFTQAASSVIYLSQNIGTKPWLFKQLCWKSRLAIEQWKNNIVVYGW